jgi:small-conductance mechanosensitive channel
MLKSVLGPVVVLIVMLGGYLLLNRELTGDFIVFAVVFTVLTVIVQVVRDRRTASKAKDTAAALGSGVNARTLTPLFVCNSSRSL